MNTPKTIGVGQGAKRPMDWRERLSELPPEQRLLLQGGSLSQRFTRHSLGLTHPALVGGFYGLLISVTLLLPMGYQKGFSEDALRAWAFIGILIILMGAIIGHFSLIVSKLIRRPPVSLPRSLVYPLPFIGLTLFTVMLVTDIEDGRGDLISDWAHYLSMILMLAPGPVYVHMSWAPRWRLLCRLEEGLDPFDGAVPVSLRAEEESLNGDVDMDQAIEDLNEDPPLLNGADSEE